MTWFRQPEWVASWTEWRDAVQEVAGLEGESLPWPYTPEPISGFVKFMVLVDKEKHE